jgi:amino acid adenylation domain-containing protein
MSGADVVDVYPLSPLQEGLLFHAASDPESRAYFVQMRYDVSGALETEIVVAAWADLCRRHDVLRTSFIYEGLDRPLQAVHADRPPEVHVEDLQTLGRAARDERVDEFCRLDRERGFDLQHDVLMRIALFRLGASRYRLVWSYHHVLLDGWSLGLLQGEFAELYAAHAEHRTPRLATPPPYRDYIAWIGAQDPEAARRHWAQLLDGYDTSAVVPRFGGAGPATFRERTLQVDRTVTRELGLLAARAHVTLSTLVTAVWGVTLARYNDVNDVVFGAVVSGRPADLPGVETMVGPFINAIPVRVTFDPAEPFALLVRRVQDAALDGAPYHHAKLAEISAASAIGSRLFDHVLVFDNYPAGSRAGADGPDVEFRALGAHDWTHYAFSLVIVPGDQMQVKFLYDGAAYGDAHVARIAGHFETALASLAAEPQTTVGAIRTLAPTESAQLAAWGGAPGPVAPARTVVELLEAQATRSPDAIALLYGGRTTTYRELNARANALARRLQSQFGVRTGDRVAILLDRSEQLVVAILAVLKAGAAYVPVDPGYSPARVTSILNDSDVRAVVTEARHRAVLAHGRPAIELPVAGEVAENAPPIARGDDLAYLIYTSGTTGEPKGVQITHASLLFYLAWANGYYFDSPHGGNFALFSPIAFDLTVTSLFLPLLRGTTLTIFPQDEEPARILEAIFSGGGAIDAVKLTPSHVAMLEFLDLRSTPVRLAIVGGEAFTPQQAALLRQLNPAMRIVNEYGPTEATVGCIVHDVGGVEATIPIGVPIAGATVAILDRERHPVPAGIAGEIYVGGPGLARGYWNRPELDRERFVSGAGARCERMYRTGDYGRWLENGEMEYLGRTDDQVKIRGNRVELGEIEHAIARCAGVARAVVVLQHDTLIAYVESAEPLDVPALREQLRVLPTFMLPSRWIRVDAVPLTANGKIDRARLTAQGPSDGPGDARPRKAIERAVTEIWSDVLGRRDLALDDRFFDVGGHSLKAMQVISRIRKQLGVALALRSFLDEPTIAATAASVRAAEPAATVTIPRTPEREHYPLSHAQERLWLIHQMGGEIAYNMPKTFAIAGDLDAAALRAALGALVERHEALRTSFILVDGEPRQRVAAVVDLPLTETDLRIEPDPEAAARAVAERDTLTPFALERAPLVRMTVMRVADRRHVILLTIHHIVGDGWSLNVLEQELLTLYDAYHREVPSSLRPLRIGYRDFAAWQRGRDQAAGERYWMAQLAGGAETLRLPYDHEPLEEERDFRGATIGRALDPDVAAALRGLASQRKTTLSNVVLTSFALALWQSSRQNDFSIGLSEANRDEVDLEPLIGFFVNILPIRVRISEGSSVDNLLDQTIATVYDAFEHRDYPFDLLVRRLNPGRIANRQPLLNVVYGFQSFRDVRVDVGASGEPSPLSEAAPFDVPFRTSKFDLCLFVSEVDGTLLLELEYDTGLFRPETVEQLAQCIEECARIVVDRGDLEVGSSTLGGEARAHELLRGLRERNATSTAYPRDASVGQLFSEIAAAYPQSTAIAAGLTRMTYAELERRSNEVARLLVAGGIGAESFVGVILERSPQMIVALVGILKAGAAYVPLAGDLPYERLRELLVDTQARWLVSDRRHLRIANKLHWECPQLESLLCVDSDDLATELEDDGGIMDAAVWDYVAQEAFDDISGGGWRDSYTGEWLSRDVMDQYGENIVAKLQPLLGPNARVLEIGCATGISMFRLAPLVERYVGTDLSPGIVAWSEGEARRRGIDNVRLLALPAHETASVGEGDFDVVILNSVIECFPGHNYLRHVLRTALSLMKADGYLFLGNVWDQDLKPEFVESLHEFKREHPERAVHAKLDRSDELFLSRAFIEDLRHEFPQIERIDYSMMAGDAQSELARFGFDVLIRIGTAGERALPPRTRRSFDRRSLTACGSAPLDGRASADSLAYMMYTSGTSGSPKGVMVEHRSVVRLVRETNYARIGHGDAVLQSGALGFDASTFEIWAPLLNGGCVVLPEGRSFLHPADLARTVREHRVTTLFLTTRLFNQIVDLDVDALSGLKTLLTGGEKASPAHFNAVRDRHPELRLVHVYGPTENTTFSTFYEVVEQQARSVAIGRPISNTTAVVVDERGLPVPFGTPGELWVGGDGLARGYWGDPELTARKFVDDPVEAGRRVYRTGDLVRWRRDGEIEFLGRLDTQIKVRGYRIELEELESALLRYRLVSGAAAVATDASDGETQLVAFVTGSELDAEQLLDYAKATLPDYLVPSRIVVVPKLPLNPNGKVDRKQLEIPAAVRSGPFVAASTPLERQLADIWQRLLHHPSVDVTANFFDLGGHSLRVARMVSMIQMELGVEVPLSAVFRVPTIRELARYMSEVSRVDRRLVEDPIVPLNAVRTGPPAFAFPPGSGYCLSYLRLATLLPNPLFGLAFIERATRLEEYVELIRAVQPEGPYTLFGYSAGGKLAFRVAQELEQRGHRVSDVIIFDAARYLRPISFSDAEILEIAADFVDEITSRVLREAALLRIKRYRDFIGQCVEGGAIAADIHFVAAEGSPRVVSDANGAAIATLDGWRDVTLGRYREYRGSGAHRDMLTSPHLERNVDILRTILAGVPVS